MEVIQMNRLTRRIISVALSAILAGGLSASAFAGSVRYGDANNDGIINSNDALFALKHSVGLMKLEGEDFKRTDVNADGVINSSDALQIILYSVGKISRFDADKPASPSTPKTGDEILATYAAAVKKAREDCPSYRIKGTTEVKDADASVKNADLILILAGTSAKEMEEELVAEMLASNDRYQTICKQGSTNSFNNLPALCRLTDSSKLKSITLEVLENGNYKIDIRFNDEKNPSSGSSIVKALGMTSYDEMVEQLKEGTAIEEEGLELDVNVKLTELSYRNGYISCEINPASGEFVSLNWGTDMYMNNSMTMIVDVTTKMTTSVTTEYWDFGY